MEYNSIYIYTYTEGVTNMNRGSDDQKLTLPGFCTPRHTGKDYKASETFLSLHTGWFLTFFSVSAYRIRHFLIFTWKPRT